jgi:predicted ATPase/signal transduction histidine kinase
MHVDEGSEASQVVFESAAEIVLRGVHDGRPALIRRLREARPSAGDRARLIHGARISEGLEVAGVLRVLQAPAVSNGFSLVTEDFGGVPLRALLDRQELEIPAALRLARDLSKILGEIHQRGVVHREVQPARIYVHPRSGEVKLGGFDLGSRLRAEIAPPLGAGRGEGRLAYVSPEQTGRMNRAVDHRSDFYSLGVTLYELLTGRLPFRASDPLELIHAHLATEPEPPIALRPNVPQAVSEVVMKLLAKRAEDRYQSAWGLTVDLEECMRQLKADGTIKGFFAGEHDLTQGFVLPQRLLGRDDEGAALSAAFARASRGPSELVLLTGASGVGKRALAHELQRPVLARRGYFAEGRFDREKSRPYGALIEAFGALLRELLAESEERVAAFRGQLGDALGGAASLLAALVPEIGQLLGPLAPGPALDLAGSQARFPLIVQRFLEVFAREEHPLVLFLDDLQWADRSSLALIERLLHDPEGKHLLIVGACREGVGSADRPGITGVRALSPGAGRAAEIALRPLGLGELKRMIDEALGLGDLAETTPLAELCHRKTEGNPLAFKLFLGALHARGLLIFDADRGGFVWNLERIRKADLPGDAAGLLAAQLGALGAGTQALLRAAACLGSRFDLRTLSQASGRSPCALAVELQPALEGGLIVALGEGAELLEDAEEGGAPMLDAALAFAFAHEQVREAALAQLHGDAGPALRLALGRRLIAGLAPDERDARAFEIADLIAPAVEAVEREDERDELAALMLTAGLRARASVAHAPARRYFDVGRALLGPLAWHRRHVLCLDLSRHRAECDDLLGHHDEAERGFEEILREGASDAERCLVHRARLALARTRGQERAAIAAADRGLALLGLTIPSTEAALEAAAAEATQQVLARLTPAALVALAEAPLVHDPEERARALFLHEALGQGAPPFTARSSLLAAMLVRHALDHGASASCGGFVPFGMVIGARHGEHQVAHALGRAALRVVERIDEPRLRPMIHFGLGAYLGPWRRPIRESFLQLEQAFVGSVEAGALAQAAAAAVMSTWMRVLAGEELYGLDERAQRSRDLVQRLGLPQQAHGIAVAQRAIARFTSGVLPEEKRPWLDEEPLLRALAGWPLGLAAFWIVELVTAFLLGDLARAREADREATALAGAIAGHVLETTLCTYHCLVVAALHGEAAPDEREAQRADLEDHQRRLARWAEGCPEGFAPRVHLVAAEMARLDGRELEAMDLYDRSIAAATEHDLVQAQALGSELCARFHLARGRGKIARSYLADARHAYARWGADAKLAQLDRAFAPLLPDEPRRAEGGDRSGGGAGLDLPALLREGRAISSEIALDPLLRRVVLTLIESAGAQRGVLVVLGEAELVASAFAGATAAEVRVSPGSIESGSDLAGSVLRYVERTQELVILADAAASQFSADPYVLRARPRSILCAPIVEQRALVGVLYLENNLAPGAFTAACRAAIELLAAQAAISIDNALRHDALERRVRERDRELAERGEELALSLRRLKDTQKQLIGQEKLASLGALTAGIAHELRNPLNFVNNFALLSVDLVSDITDELRAHGRSIDPDALADLTEDLGTLRQNVSKINEHGRRADNIINGMLIHARETTGAREEIDLNALVQDCVSLAYHGMRGKDPSFNISIHTEFDPAVGVASLNPQDISRVFINIINNACYATQQRQRAAGGGYAPVLTVRTRALGDRVEVRIHDNGTGIPPEVVDKIYMPFFTTKPTGEGTGLGLALSHDIIVTGHQGEIRVATATGEFTEFSIVLPRRAAAPSPARAS